LSTGLPGAGQYPAVTSSVARLPVVSSSMVGDAAEPRARIALPPFDALYDEYFDFVWRTARRLGVPEVSADDVVQDAFLVLHRRAPDYDGVTPVKRWLLGIVVRVVSDHRRRYKRKDAPCVPHAADSDGNVLLASSQPPPSAEVEQAEAVRLLDRLLSELDEAKREVLVLAELEEMTVPEIAELLGANVNTIYARLRAARRELDAAHARHLARNERRKP
jgi:RNA polymerase sigma-70 factor (ECF subfamily)